MMAVLFSADLSWLSPLFIFVGVLLYITRKDSKPGRIGRVLIGLGLMLLALRLVVEATEPLLQAPAVRTLLASVSSDLFMELLLGAVLAVVSYSSLAVVLLIAAMASSGAIPIDVALGLTLGANLGSGLVAAITTAKSAVEERQVTIGNLLFKIMGVAIVAPFIGLWTQYVQVYLPNYLPLPAIVAGSDLLATVPGHLLRQLPAGHGLVVAPLPLALPPVQVSMIWHRAQDRSPDMRWLRERLLEIAGDLRASEA